MFVCVSDCDIDGLLIVNLIDFFSTDGRWVF